MARSHDFGDARVDARRGIPWDALFISHWTGPGIRDPGSEKLFFTPHS